MYVLYSLLSQSAVSSISVTCPHRACPSVSTIDDSGHAATLLATANARIAFPLDLCHLARSNINFKWAKMANAALTSLEGNFVVSGRHRSPKMSLVVSGE